MFDNLFNPDKPYSPTGTTRPIYVPREPGDASPAAVQPGENYFFVKIHSAQAAFQGAVWEQVRQLLVTSQVALNHPLLGAEPLKAIQRSRAVKRRQAVQLGLSPNLINLVPAAMTHVSVSIEFVLDKKNRLVDLAGLINSDVFLAAVSLAPGAAVAAKTIGGLSQKIVQTFLEPEELQPILQFGGDFNIPANDLRDGYYVILGTRDADNPLPSSNPVLQISNGRLLLDGAPVSQLSYVILDLRVVPARTRSLNDGAVWAEKLRQAEGLAQQMANDPFAEDNERQKAWEDCRILIKEAQLLLNADPNFLPQEANNIIKDSYTRCRKQIFETEERLTVRGTKGLEAVDSLDDTADRRFLGLDPGEDLTESLHQYAEQVAASRHILRDEGLM